ncbi:CsgG/HfaB family protein [Calditrichota bacterium GD2]
MRHLFTKIIHVRYLLALVFFTFSCATTALYLTVKRPAEINLKGYKKVAIADIVNSNGAVDQHSRDIADEITTTLFNSGVFEVLDRNHINQLIKEHQLAKSGLIDENTASELGKFIGSAVLVFGRIQNDKYSEEIIKGDPWTDKKGKRHQSITRKGLYSLAVNIKVVDVQTAKILAVKTLSTGYTSKTYADNATPAKINVEGLYRSCLEDIASQFMRLVAPYDVQVKAIFQKDKDIPEVELAITQFKVGEWDEGINLLKTAANREYKKPKTKAKAYYNLGLALTYYGKFDEALAILKKALTINPKSKLYQNAILNAKREKQKYEELKKQQTAS